MTILDKIIAEKKHYIKKLKDQTFDFTQTKRVKTFREMIRDSSHMNIISEIKRASPSKGPIHMEVDPVQQAQTYERLGAKAISVLTDTPFFKGTMDDLRAVREAVNLPILCKDFVIDTLQIDEAKDAGANIILLIVAALPEENLKRLYHYAKTLDLEVICEVHNESEMEMALTLGAEIIGINNRDLKTFKVDLDTTHRLASMVTDPNTILISESGLKTQEDIISVQKAGAEAILIGETLMRSNDLDKTFCELQVPLKQVKVDPS